MTMFVFAALIVTAVIGITWGTTAVALRQSHQEQVTMEDGARPAGRSRKPGRHLVGRSRLHISACGEHRAHAMRRALGAGRGFRRKRVRRTGDLTPIGGHPPRRGECTSLIGLTDRRSRCSTTSVQTSEILHIWGKNGSNYGSAVSHKSMKGMSMLKSLGPPQQCSLHRMRHLPSRVQVKCGLIWSQILNSSVV